MRYVYGPGFSFNRAAKLTPAAVAAAKTDVTVTVSDPIDDKLRVTIPPYDLATHNWLQEVRAYVLPSGSEAPADAAALVASDTPGTVQNVSHITGGGGDVTLTLPDGEEGAFVGLTVLGFEF